MLNGLVSPADFKAAGGRRAWRILPPNGAGSGRYIMHPMPVSSSSAFFFCSALSAV
jgi:hypothetical protein